MAILRKLLCALGLHGWTYQTLRYENARKCKRCNRQEVRIEFFNGGWWQEVESLEKWEQGYKW